MQTKILNKLSPEGRERIIELEGKLRNIQEELSINFILEKNSGKGIF